MIVEIFFMRHSHLTIHFWKIQKNQTFYSLCLGYWPVQKSRDQSQHILSRLKNEMLRNIYQKNENSFFHYRYFRLHRDRPRIMLRFSRMTYVSGWIDEVGAYQLQYVFLLSTLIVQPSFCSFNSFNASFYVRVYKNRLDWEQ